MLRIVTRGLDESLRMIRRLEREADDQVASALNILGTTARTAAVGGVQGRFIVRQPRKIENAIRVTSRASTRQLYVTISVAPFLAQHESGGLRLPGQVSKNLPHAIDPAERNRRVRSTKKALARRGTFLGRTKTGKVAIYRRRTRRFAAGVARERVLLYVFEPQIRLAARLHFNDTVNAVVERDAQRALARVYDKLVERKGR